MFRRTARAAALAALLAACLFDPTCEIANMPAGRYHVEVRGNDLPDGAEPLVGVLDLAAEPAGLACELSDGYPWCNP